MVKKTPCRRGVGEWRDEIHRYMMHWSMHLRLIFCRAMIEQHGVEVSGDAIMKRRERKYRCRQAVIAAASKSCHVKQRACPPLRRQRNVAGARCDIGLSRLQYGHDEEPTPCHMLLAMITPYEDKATSQFQRARHSRP